MRHTKKTALIAMAFTVGLAMTACTNSDTQKDADSIGSKTQAVESDNNNTETTDHVKKIATAYGYAKP